MQAPWKNLWLVQIHCVMFLPYNRGFVIAVLPLAIHLLRFVQFQCILLQMQKPALALQYIPICIMSLIYLHLQVLQISLLSIRRHIFPFITHPPTWNASSSPCSYGMWHILSNYTRTEVWYAYQWLWTTSRWFPQPYPPNYMWTFNIWYFLQFSLVLTPN